MEPIKLAEIINYLKQGKIIKTVESPRDLQVPDEITQYSKNFTSSEEIHDILFLSRPDNIIFDEMSREAINKNLKTQIRKYKYKIIVFQFTVKTDTAYKRDIKRAELLEHPKMGREKIDKLYKMHDDRFDKEAILVDTNKLNKKQVVDLIIKELK